jgi:hypothetical protein
VIRAALLVATIAALPVQAQTYKCTDGDRTAYSEAPCGRGQQTVLPKPDAPATKPEAAPLQRLQDESARLQRERQTREAREDREDAARARQAAKRRDRCAKLELDRKWAEDDMRRASHHTADAARLQARRAAERHAAACQ